MEDFRRWARCPDPEIDLARAALAIARDEYPDLDEAGCLARLDAMAAAAARGGEPPVDALNRELFQVQGLRGNAADFYDPRNSYLNDVLERGLGIPITLSVIYLEVGWRLGLTLAPLGFPGHFLVALDGDGGRVIVDPFHAGRRVGGEDLLERLAAVVGAQAAPAALAQALASVPRREVVARMLRNLKGIHLKARDWPRALRVTDRLAALLPDQPSELRDRARLYERLEAHGAAAADYARYLERAPGAPDAGAVRARLEALGPVTKRLN